MPEGRETRDLVARGYDALGEGYRRWAAATDDDARERFVADLACRLEPGAWILDLGCGSGAGSTRQLAEDFGVVGVDLSMEQLRLARMSAPGVALVRGDLTEVAFRPGSFDAVVALYSLGHVPRGQHGAIFEAIAGWLRPGGLALLTLPTGDDPGTVEEWLGVDMFFSGHPVDVSRRLLTDAGFELLVDEVVTIREPQSDASFLWVLARRAVASAASASAEAAQ